MIGQLPQGACDCHFHIIGPASRYAFAKERSYTPKPATVEDYKATFNALRIERGVLVQPSVYGLDNSCLCDNLRQLGTNNYRGVAVIDDAVAQERLVDLHQAGIRAVRCNLRLKGGVPLDKIPTLARRIAGLGWHLELNHDGEEIHRLADLLAKVPPEMDVVLDHLGHVPFSEGASGATFQALLRLLDGGRVWTKLTGLRLSEAHPQNTGFENVVRQLIERHSDRCIWGSDWPHVVRQGEMPDDRRLLQVLMSWTPTEASRRRIFIENAATLYGFGPRGTV